MNFIKIRYVLLGSVLSSLTLVAQQKAPAAQQAPAAKPAPPQAQANAGQPEAKKPDRAAAYYHFARAHMYEEMIAMYGRSEYATKAIEEYRLAIENDPSSDFLNAGLPELYA